MEVKNILVPIDFSKCSKNALKTAIRLAKINEAKIHLVNAIHVHTPHPDLSGGSLLESIISDYENQVKQSFEELESEIIELKDVPHETDRFVSYLTDAIWSEVSTKEIDLIVMGTRAEHEKLEHLLGTHATDVIQSSDIPVLVIPEGMENLEAKRIGFASDFLKIKFHSSIDILRWICDAFNSELFVFHVKEEEKDLTSQEEKQVHKIGEMFEGLNYSVRTSEANDVVDGINKFVDFHQLDVLAMMPRRHGLFRRLFSKSITKEVTIDPTIPMLTFHDV